MRYLVGVMIVGFSLVGAWLVFLGLRGLWRTWLRRPFLESAEGEIVRVDRREPNWPERSGTTPTSPAFYPVVRFKTAMGEDREFRSEVGKVAGSSPYAIGSHVDVLYDPVDEVPPVIDEWFAIWGGNLLLLLGGLLFCGGAALTVWALGDRVLGGP